MSEHVIQWGTRCLTCDSDLIVHEDERHARAANEADLRYESLTDDPHRCVLLRRVIGPWEVEITTPKETPG